MSEQPKQFIRFAEFELDAAHRLLRRNGETLALNAKAFDLLEFLAENAGRVVSKDEILDAVWCGQFVEEANLKVQISALRKTLGERKNEHRFLVTVPGKGYKFVADIESNNDEIVIEKHKFSRFVVENVSESSALASRISFAQLKNYKLQIFGAIVIFLALITVGFWLFERNAENHASVVLSVRAENQTRLRRLTNQGRINRAKISLDGKFFAYTLVERGSYRTEIRLGQTDSATDVLLRPIEDVFHHPLSFSADGNWLYYVNTSPVSESKESRGALYKVPVLNGVPQKLGDNISIYAVISPDEKYIAFPRNNRANKTSTIVIADLDGANEREIAARPSNLPFDSDSISWSADGQFIALAAANKIDAKNSAKKSYEVFIAGVADGILNQLTSLEFNGIQCAEWLKDGSGIVVLAQDKSKTIGAELWLIDNPGGKARKLSRDVNSYAGSLSTAADSNSLIAIQSEHESNIWLTATEDIAAAQQITFSTSGRRDGWYGMDFAPDGKIIYTAWIDQSLTIWSMDADGKDAKQLTSLGFRDERPVVTADGQFIVFQSNRSGETEIWRMNIDGGNLQRLTTGDGNTSPSVTADGLWVVYRHAEEGDGSLWRVPLAGGEPILLSDRQIWIPRVSPDGKHIACGLGMDGKMKLAVFSVEGGEPLKIFDLPKNFNFRYRLQWSSDGRFISYPDEANGIWMQNFAGGEPKLLEGIPEERIFTFIWSRDGKQFAYGRSREVREAVLISDFR